MWLLYPAPVTLENRWLLKAKGRSEISIIFSCVFAALCYFPFFRFRFIFSVLCFWVPAVRPSHRFPRILFLLTSSPLRMCFFNVLLPHIHFLNSVPAFLTLPNLLLLLLTRDLCSLPVPRHPELPLSSLQFSHRLQSITSSSPLGVIFVCPSVSLPLSIHPSSAFWVITL